MKSGAGGRRLGAGYGSAPWQACHLAQKFWDANLLPVQYFLAKNLCSHLHMEHYSRLYIICVETVSPMFLAADLQTVTDGLGIISQPLHSPNTIPLHRRSQLVDVMMTQRVQKSCSSLHACIIAQTQDVALICPFSSYEKIKVLGHNFHLACQIYDYDFWHQRLSLMD